MSKGKKPLSPLISPGAKKPKPHKPKPKSLGPLNLNPRYKQP
jgi:hypothetical protein